MIDPRRLRRATIGGRLRRPASILALVMASTTIAAACSTEAGESGASTASPPASAPGSMTSGPVPPRTTGTSSGPGPIEFSPCRGSRDVECATLEAPLDHDDPDGEVIELAVVRRPATGPDRIGTLFVNPGGPGGSATDFVRSNAWSSDLVEQFDIIGVDPRGVGGSTPLGCARHPAAEDFRDVDSAPIDEAGRQRLEAAAAEVSAACADTDAPLLAHLGVEEAADDLDWVRRALGEEEISILGFSWGTLLGLTYAQRHPDALRALVLDGVVDPVVDLIELLDDQAAGLEGTFERFTTACAERPSCPVDDVEATYDRVEDQLRDLGQGGPGPATLRLAAIASSYGAGGTNAFLGALGAADRGDYARLEALASSYTTAGDLAPYLAYLCRDHAHPSTVEGWHEAATSTGAEAPRLGPAVIYELLPCATWPVEATERSSAVDRVPAGRVLVIGLTGDAATPFAYAVAVDDRLEDSVLVTHEGTGHTSYGQSACVRRLVDRFLTTAARPDPATSC